VADTGASEAGEAVRRAMGRLTPTLREAVELVVFQDLPYAEAGEVLGVPLGTVKSRIFNALKKLKEHLGHERRS
jgi:RNA polymerase sigma-70 factor (ECF subfamily)